RISAPSAVRIPTACPVCGATMIVPSAGATTGPVEGTTPTPGPTRPPANTGAGTWSSGMTAPSTGLLIVKGLVATFTVVAVRVDPPFVERAAGADSILSESATG